MKKNILLVLPLLLLLSSAASSQSPNWLWAKGMYGASNDEGRSVAIDALGNVYTTGFFQGTVDFDPGAGTFNLTSASGADIFISKLDASGNFVWAKAMGGPGGGDAESITLDVFGNIYTTGYFHGTVDFDPDSSGTYNLTTIGLNPNIFISKLDNSGNFIWAKAMRGLGNSDTGYSIAIDASGNVFTTGSFWGTVDFDPDSSGTFNVTAAGVYDIYISKLDSSGNFVWAKAIGGTGNTGVGFSIALDASENVYTTGYFNGTIDFNPGTGTYNLTSAGADDIFISKLDSSGNFVWAKRMGGTSYDIGLSITIDNSGNVYSSGDFQSTVDFDPGVGIFNLTSTGYSDAFISKLDSSGNFVWAKAVGGTDGNAAYSITLDAYGNIYTTGYFKGTSDFDPGAGVFNLTSTAGSDDIFISKLDSSGNFLWAKAIGGTNADFGHSIVIGTGGNVYMVGRFYSSYISFGSNTLTNADTTGNTADIFIAKLDTILVTRTNEIKNFDNRILLFPNPATNHLTITLPNANKKVEVTITDITGKIIYSTTATETQKIEVNAKNFAEGIYLVKIQTEEFFKTEKLIITK